MADNPRHQPLPLSRVPDGIRYGLSRRWFLRGLGVLAAGAAVDLEFLTWVPGQTKYFLPPVGDVMMDRHAGIAIRLVQQWSVMTDQTLLFDRMYGWKDANNDVTLGYAA